MNKSAVVGTVVICASIAFAAQQQQSGQPLRGSIGGGVQDPEPPGQPMGSLAGGGCTVGEPLNWFTVVHEMPECQYVEGTGMNVADVNVDGEFEYFIHDHMNTPVVIGGVPVDGLCLMPLQVLTIEAGAAGQTHFCVLTSDAVGTFMAGAPHFANQANLGLYPSYRDMDLDRDHDLLVDCEWVGGDGQWQYTRLWIENTGYEYNPPLAADINGDGAVGATDLSMLLAAWTGAQ